MAVTALAVATGCSASSGDDSGGKVTLTVDVFGNFGYSEAGLYKLVLRSDKRAEQ